MSFSVIDHGNENARSFDTRAMKRAVSWASGLGIVAYSELQNSL